MGPSGPAIDPPRAILYLLGDSEGLSIRMGIRPAVAGHVGSFSLDLTSKRGYGGYPGGGKVPIFAGNGSMGGRSVGQ
jgi:hypothetical protein